MNKLLIICGPTATGKTSLGISLAKKFNGEIVSADSRQAYIGMDIGTGKGINNQINKFQISKSILNDKLQIGFYKINGVKVWLYDVCQPDYKFNVADFVECAQIVAKDIWARGKLPILVGGTGFYIKALIEGIGSIGIEPDWELREKLSNYPIIKLSNLLKETDLAKWETMNLSDRKNPRRLIRAIEISLKMKKDKLKKKNYSLGLKRKSLLIIGLNNDFSLLYQKIDRHVDQRIKAGVEKEVKTLLSQGFNWNNSVLGTTIGYQEWEPLIGVTKDEGLSSKLRDEVIKDWKFVEHAYARRQMTWFKKQPNINWFDISKKDWQKKVDQLVNQWYHKNG